MPIERRRDRRHAVTGQASLRPLSGGADVYGGILDVSAGGVRLRVRPGHGMLPGTAVDVTLEVALPAAPQAVPPVQLCGTGIALRSVDVDGPSSELTLRFLAPLAVWEGFSAPALAGVPRRRSPARA